MMTLLEVARQEWNARHITVLVLFAFCLLGSTHIANPLSLSLFSPFFFFFLISSMPRKIIILLDGVFNPTLYTYIPLFSVMSQRIPRLHSARSPIVKSQKWIKYK